MKPQEKKELCINKMKKPVHRESKLRSEKVELKLASEYEYYLMLILNENN